MAQVEQNFISSGIQIIWVLQQDGSFKAGTAEGCRQFMKGQGSSHGLCVGDGETQPNPKVFDMSNLAKGRGFDLLVRRSDMVITFTTTHGTPSGNENLTGQQLLEKIQQL